MTTYTAELTGEQIFGFADLVRRLSRADVDRPLRQDLAAALMAFEALMPEPSAEDGDAYLAAVQAGRLPAWGMDLLPIAEFGGNATRGADVAALVDDWRTQLQAANDQARDLRALVAEVAAEWPDLLSDDQRARAGLEPLG